MRKRVVVSLIFIIMVMLAGRTVNAAEVLNDNAYIDTEKRMGRDNSDPGLKVLGVNIPVKITEGQSFAPTGTITSNYPITWLWIGVNPYGSYSHVVDTDCNPMTKTYDISAMTKKLNIASLKPGKYTYQIDAISNGTYKVIYSGTFNVEAKDKPTVHLDHSNIAKGETVKITWSKIEGATKYILDCWHDGKEILWKDVTNLSSYEVTHDEIGQYGYFIIAVTGSGSSEITRTSKGATIYVEEPKMIFKGDTFPSEITQGKHPEYRGEISANGKITWVWVGVQEGNTWSHVIDTSTNPMKFTYVVDSLVSKLAIEDLKPGEYTFQIDAISAGQYKTFVRTPFTVKHKHIYNSGKVTQKATCTASGTKKYTCTQCGKTKTTTLKKLGHKYSTKWTVDKRATATANGSRSKHCTRCSAKSSVTTIYKASNIKLTTSTYAYSGKAKKPGVVVKDSKGKTISSDYYDVKYSSGRKKIGTYKVTIELKGRYKGTVKKSFKIVPKKMTLKTVSSPGKKKLTISWAKESNVTGYEVRFSTDKNFKNTTYKRTYSSKTTKQTIVGVPNKKTYYVKIRAYKKVDGKTYNGSWSLVKKVWIK